MKTIQIQTEQQKVISYLTMSKTIGWLGILLPFILILGNLFFNKLNLLNNKYLVSDGSQVYVPSSSLKASISHYYYTSVGPLFIGAMFAVALFLFAYKGYEKRKNEFGFSDNFMTNFAAICAVGLVIFPTSANEFKDNVLIFLSSPIVGGIHLIFAFLFFITLAFMSIINFRRTHEINVYGKQKEHKIYKISGITMLVCLVFIVIYGIFFEHLKIEWLRRLKPIFTLETIALIAFGISWLTKGKVECYIFNKNLKRKAVLYQN